MEIQIDRDKKLLLLRWLKQGYIDSFELSELQRDNDNQITVEEIERELDRLTRVMGDEECMRLQRLGLCKLKNLYSREERQKDLGLVDEACSR